MITYRTIREAAIAATLQAISLSKRDGWEYGGTIYRGEDSFYFDGPYTSKNETEVTTFIDKSKDPVGMYHTHVGDDWHGKVNAAEYFSEPDLLNAVRFKIFTYLGHCGSGKIFEIDARSEDNFTRTSDEVAHAFTATGQATVAKGTEIYNPRQGSLHAA